MFGGVRDSPGRTNLNGCFRGIIVITMSIRKRTSGSRAARAASACVVLSAAISACGGISITPTNESSSSTPASSTSDPQQAPSGTPVSPSETFSGTPGGVPSSGPSSPVWTAPGTPDEPTPEVSGSSRVAKGRGFRGYDVHTVFKPRSGSKEVALTFDDGPSAEYTEKILDILEDEGVRATFFVMGSQVEDHPSLVRKSHNAGMSIQAHSWSHQDYARMTSDEIRRDVLKTNTAIEDAIGSRPNCVRPPYGSINPKVSNSLKKEGMKNVLWSGDSKDWQKPGVSAIASNSLLSVHSGSILLFHDAGGERSQTVKSLPRIIDKLKKDGYSFVTLCD